ncbi:hypothetical protein O3M35_009078 [Rhynocoris fuscipes]|uniref:Uncharacterized protein n=1 Tax=Rhynocoris fuscipes TaxID=488301 RepID=A0AAW1D4C7_9HEMI
MMTRQKFYIEIGAQGSHVLSTSDFFYYIFMKFWVVLEFTCFICIHFDLKFGI